MVDGADQHHHRTSGFRRRDTCAELRPVSSPNGTVRPLTSPSGRLQGIGRDLDEFRTNVLLRVCAAQHMWRCRNQPHLPATCTDTACPAAPTPRRTGDGNLVACALRRQVAVVQQLLRCRSHSKQGLSCAYCVTPGEYPQRTGECRRRATHRPYKTLRPPATQRTAPLRQPTGPRLDQTCPRRSRRPGRGCPAMGRSRSPTTERSTQTAGTTTSRLPSRTIQQSTRQAHRRTQRRALSSPTTSTAQTNSAPNHQSYTMDTTHPRLQLDFPTANGPRRQTASIRVTIHVESHHLRRVQLRPATADRQPSSKRPVQVAPREIRLHPPPQRRRNHLQPDSP